MGDFKKSAATKNEALESAAAEREKRTKGQSGTVKKIVGQTEQKSKAISGKVYPEIWEEFTRINRAQGISNNSALNMIISKYNRENKQILES